MNKFYYNKKELIENNNLFCLGIDLTTKEIEKIKDEYVIYDGSTPFSGYPIIEGKILKKATLKECIQLGYLILKEGEILQENKIVAIQRPSPQYCWNFKELKWIVDENTLRDGEDIKNNEIIKIPCNDIFLQPIWNKIERIWQEGATAKDFKNRYYTLINVYKEEIRENGFIYTDKTGKEHQQKCRDRDLSLLGNAISAQEDLMLFKNEESTTFWSFNDGDILEMSLQDLKILRLKGAIFIQSVFDTEAYFKDKDINILFEKDEFIEKVKEFSNTKGGELWA